jgi:hypothetical protein
MCLAGRLGWPWRCRRDRPDICHQIALLEHVVHFAGPLFAATFQIWLTDLADLRALAQVLVEAGLPDWEA